MAIQIADSLDSLVQDWTALPHSADTSDKFVLGDVHLDAKIALIGEAPGEDEDREGVAFCGRSGMRLDSVLRQGGMSRNQVSISNVLPRRPKDNRDPTDAEISSNAPFVERLLKLHPNLRAVAVMGNAALKWKTGRIKISAYRGYELQQDGLWWLPMFHPANSLYKPSEGKWLVSDLRWLKTLSEGNLLNTSGMTFPLDQTGVTLEFLKPDILASPISYVDIETSGDGVPGYWWWDPRVHPVLFSFGWIAGNGEPDVLIVEANEATLPGVRDLLAANPLHWGGGSALYFDFPLLRRLGLPPSCQQSFLDSYTMAKLNDENRGLGVKNLAKQHLRAISHEPYWGDDEKEAWQSRWHEWPSMSREERLERINYSGKDAFLGLQVLQIEMERLKEKPHLVKAYRDLAVPQAQAIEEMELTGLPVNIVDAVMMSLYLEMQTAEIAKTLDPLVPEEAHPVKTSKLRGKEPIHTPQPVNFLSAIQVSKIIFGTAGLPRVKVTPGGDRASVDKFAMLKSLDLEGSPQYPAWAFEVIRGRLQSMRLDKRKGYVNALIDAANRSHDGRVHASFLTVPVTWRLSSEDVNLQQLQSEVKTLAQAPEGWTFVKHDFSNLEGRGLADQTQDPKMVARFRNDEDLHWAHTVGFMHWSPNTKRDKKDEFREKVRNSVKTLMFAGAYGAGINKLADTIRAEFDQIGIGRDVVLEMLRARGLHPGKDAYITLAKAWSGWLAGEYPHLKLSFAKIAQETGRRGYIRSKLNFERRLPDIRDPDDTLRMEAERQAFNFPVQNLSCLTFLAYREMRKIRQDMELESDIHLVVQEHDSLLWLCRQAYAELWEIIGRHVMEHVDFAEWGSTFLVPLRVDGVVSARWE